MSIREQEAPDFAQSLRGYDRAQVDEYIAWARTQAIEAEERARHAESALVQCRRELATSPTTAGISQRLAAMLQLATEEADDIRSRARADSEATIREATDQAERTIDVATRHRDAIQREVEELSEIREQLVQRLIEVGGDIVGATERFRGYLPGTAPVTAAHAPLFDAEADDPPTDPPEMSDGESPDAVSEP